MQKSFKILKYVPGRKQKHTHTRTQRTALASRQAGERRSASVVDGGVGGGGSTIDLSKAFESDQGGANRDTCRRQVASHVDPHLSSSDRSGAPFSLPRLFHHPPSLSDPCPTPPTDAPVINFSLHTLTPSKYIFPYFTEKLQTDRRDAAPPPPKNPFPTHFKLTP